MFDFAAISRLGEILKSSSSANLQTKTSLILDYLAYFDENIEIFIAAGIESAIDAVFQQSGNYGMHKSYGRLLALGNIVCTILAKAQVNALHSSK